LPNPVLGELGVGVGDELSLSVGEVRIIPTPESLVRVQGRQGQPSVSPLTIVWFDQGSGVFATIIWNGEGSRVERTSP
jgi:hypothetical protein